MTTEHHSFRLNVFSVIKYWTFQIVYQLCSWLNSLTVETKFLAFLLYHATQRFLYQMYHLSLIHRIHFFQFYVVDFRAERYHEILVYGVFG